MGAERVLSRADHRDDPGARDALLWRAVLYMEEGQNEKAKELVLRSLEPEPLFGAPRMILAEILRTEGDGDGAIREQLKVLEQGPSNISAIRWLARAYLDAGALDKARARLEENRAAFERNFLWRAAWALLLEAMDSETLKMARGQTNRSHLFSAKRSASPSSMRCSATQPRRSNGLRRPRASGRPVLRTAQPRARERRTISAAQS
jgi:tetratricopeptide (TPR) repeat protein